MTIYGHAKKGVSGIKHFHWVQPICLHFGLCSFLKSIEHDFIKALMIQPNNDLAQSVEH